MDFEESKESAGEKNDTDNVSLATPQAPTTNEEDENSAIKIKEIASLQMDNEHVLAPASQEDESLDEQNVNMEINVGEFKLVPIKCQDPSSVWHYFQKHTFLALSKCNFCSALIKCRGSTTSGMRNHLKRQHDVLLDEIVNSAPAPTSVPSSSQQSMDNKESQGESSTTTPISSFNDGVNSKVPHESSDQFQMVEHKCYDPTSVWQYFRKHVTEELAKCNMCDALLKCRGGTTSGMRNHIQRHGIQLKRIESFQTGGQAYSDSDDDDDSRDENVETSTYNEASSMPLDGSDDDTSYEIVPQKCEDPSSVWHYFKKHCRMSVAKCNMCGEILKRPSGTTTGMRKHLIKNHNVSLSISESSNQDESLYSQSQNFDLSESEYLNEGVAAEAVYDDNIHTNIETRRHKKKSTRVLSTTKAKKTFSFRNIGCVNCSLAFTEGSDATKNLIRVIPVKDGSNEFILDDMNRHFIKTEISNYEAFLRVFEGFLLFNNVQLSEQDLWMCFECAETFSELTYFYDKFFRLTVQGSDIHELINYGGETDMEELEEIHEPVVPKRPRGRPKKVKPSSPAAVSPPKSKRGRKRKQRHLDNDYVYDEIAPETTNFGGDNYQSNNVDEELMDPMDVKALVKVEVGSGAEDNDVDTGEMNSFMEPEDEYEPSHDEPDSAQSDGSDYSSEERKRKKQAKKGQRSRGRRAGLRNKPRVNYRDVTSEGVPLRGNLGSSKFGSGPSTGHICRFCGEEFFTKSLRKEHIMAEHTITLDSNKLQCKLCNHVYKDIASLHRHGATHSGIAIYTCERCDKSFTRSDHLRDHERVVHGWGIDDEDGENFDPTTCGNCKTKFNSTEALAKHLETSGCRPYVCTLCSRAYSSKRKRDAHKRMVHHAAKSRPGRTGTDAVCEFCGESFPFKKFLRSHIMSQHGTQLEDGRIECKICNARFVNMRNLRRHALSHTGASTRVRLSPFRCSPCKLSFQQKVHYESHLESQLHLFKTGKITSLDPGGLEAGCEGGTPITETFQLPDPKVNSCLFCDENFETRKQRNKHLLELHGTLQEDKVKVQCNVCKTVCSSLYKLHRHALTHTSKRNYDCPFCPKSFKYHDDMLKHGRRMHPGEGVMNFKFAKKPTGVACTYCNKLLNTKNQRLRHALANHGSDIGKGRIQCRTCDKIFISGPLFVSHGRLHNKSAVGSKLHGLHKLQRDKASESNTTGKNPAGTIQCQKCGVIFLTAASFKEHKTLNRCKSTQFPCPVCSKVFYLVGSRDRHVQVFHKSVTTKVVKRTLKCTECDRTFTSCRHYKRHMATHSEIRPYVCVLCDKAFKIKAYLFDHFKTKSHLAKVEDNGGKDVQPEKIDSKCKKCDLQLPTTTELFEHMCKEHGDDRPFSCEKCWRRYKSKNKLLRHVLSFHERLNRETLQPKPAIHKCPHCDKQFKRKASLEDHVNFHVTAKPYLCSECGATFKYRQSYHRHLKDMHTNQGTFTCDQCGKVFKRKTNLVQHLNSKLHNGPGGYVSKKRKNNSTQGGMSKSRSKAVKREGEFSGDLTSGNRPMELIADVNIHVPEGAEATVVYQAEDGSLHAGDSVSSASSAHGAPLHVAYPNVMGHQEPGTGFSQPQFFSFIHATIPAYMGTQQQQAEQHHLQGAREQHFQGSFYSGHSGSSGHGHHSHHHSHH